MPEDETPAAPGRSDEERAALFDELMREERRRGPVNGYAIATLVFGLLGGLLAPVFAVVAGIRIKDRQERGIGLVVAGLVAFTVWVVVDISLWTNRATGADSATVKGYDLKVGDCFQAPGASSETSVARASCTDWHTGEAYADFSLPDGPYPGIVELYDQVLDRCEKLALADPAVFDANGGVQVMTLAPDTWAKRKPHHIVCYFRFANEVDHPL